MHEYEYLEFLAFGVIRRPGAVSEHSNTIFNRPKSRLREVDLIFKVPVPRRRRSRKRRRLTRRRRLKRRLRRASHSRRAARSHGYNELWLGREEEEKKTSAKERLR
jgi:hypothetical protein